MSWCPNLRSGLFWNKTWKIFSTEREKKWAWIFMSQTWYSNQSNKRHKVHVANDDSQFRFSLCVSHTLSVSLTITRTRTRPLSKALQYKLQSPNSKSQRPTTPNSLLFLFLPSFLPSLRPKKKKLQKQKLKITIFFPITT